MVLITVRPVEPGDATAWLGLRTALWPDGAEVHPAEIDRFLSLRSKEPVAVLIAEDGAQVPGFAELWVWSYAEGCRTDRVGYLEGWYVVPEARRRGVGRALVEAAEEWARAQGCSELASDVEPANEISAAAHRAIGFSEAGTIVCYRKDLSNESNR